MMDACLPEVGRGAAFGASSPYPPFCSVALRLARFDSPLALKAKAWPRPPLATWAPLTLQPTSSCPEFPH